MLLTNTPNIVDNLIERLKVKATSDGYTAIVTQLNNLSPTTWFNLPFKLNALMAVIKNYQLLLIDGDLQDLIDDIGIIYWFTYFRKVAVLIDITELIESL
jgi:hypothetical protein